MTDTFRPPKAVRAETPDLPATLTVADVLELSERDGETGAWAQRITADLQARAAQIMETRMETLVQKRAEGQDIALSDALAFLLGEVFEFYARAHEAHWNVTGSDFSEYHALFGEIYEDAHGSIDPLAENLRKIGSLTPALAVMPCESRETDPTALAMQLLEESTELVDEFRVAFDIATAVGQQGIANFLAERQDAHAKWAWQLRASLGIAEIGTSPAVDVIAETDMAEDAMETNSADPDVEERRSLIEACEKRDYTAEVRAVRAEDGGMRLRGYAAMWDREADGLPFREVIKPGAFKRSLAQGDDVFLLINHDTDQLPLARRSAGTLDLVEDHTGLLIDAELDPKNPRAMELASALERGDVDKMSFAFTVAPEGSVRNDDGVRELRDLTLYEVSVVTWPAYSATTVGMRDAQDDDLELRRRYLAAKQRHFNI